jgi:ribonucleoside-diphosphate reductase alpha chain
LVEQVCEKLPKDTRDAIYEVVRDMQFIPGGRYLYYAGRGVRFFNNCFTGNTRALTNRGWIALRQIQILQEKGEDIKLLSPVDGEYKEARVLNHGEQPVNEITFIPVRGRSKKKYIVHATPNHSWILTNGKVTENLSVGDIVPANKFHSGENDLGFIHGFIYGDGNRNGQLRLCSDKDQLYLPYLKDIDGVNVTYPDYADGDPVIYCNKKVDWKELPSTDDPAYINSFIEGWIAADGSGDRMLCSVNKKALEWFRQYAAYSGIVISGELREQVRDIKIGQYEYKDHSIFIQNFSRGEKWEGFKVKSIRPHFIEEEVFCPFEKEYNRFVIEHNIDTRNCYLLSAEEDTREDWANLSWKSESCLLTGGGIGIDYSVYRPSTEIITRTGGLASGPVPKMLMVNEIGRRIMQGGSRRSAIYASLRHDHGDIEKFLVAKDWHKQAVGGTGKTLWDVKQDDPNFPAPLDMTNVSVNYDTKWLMEYYKTGDVGEVFTKNVEQALTTGEPGFSFNFFEKENETLRNACTEVTSSDDSDVCNLGSVNMSRISTVSEFARVVELGTLFLLCGTLTADLPYAKVHDVREKNRRLGLGLMGIHEWLIKRGYKYEVTPELHQWLSVYKGVSDDVSKRASRDLSVSQPVANRSIAPTGTIGMVAGTTTGIEPVYAVAYKRRYLKNNRWHSQYEIDHAAKTLIEETGVAPEKVESAIDLAKDYERRIRFQADVQDYVDMAISSTINLPPRDTQGFSTKEFASTLASFSRRLRGFTCYPDGARGGQPLKAVPYEEAKKNLGKEFDEHVEWNDVCNITGGGYCGT